MKGRKNKNNRGEKIEKEGGGEVTGEKGQTMRYETKIRGRKEIFKIIKHSTI